MNENLSPTRSDDSSLLVLRVLAWLGLAGYLLLVAALAVLAGAWWLTY